MTDETAFRARQKELIERMMAGEGNAEQARDAFGPLEPAELLERWITTCGEMADQLGNSDAKRRLPWFGPDMGVRMFTTARLMETWAHGQELYDLKGVHREPTDRIHHIAVIGMKTFAWTFVNRQMEVPGPPPHVSLSAPSGEIWQWNEANDAERISGEAAEFCHVVTQGRSIAETNLEVEGEVATLWMSIAQCFAGGAVNPPKPGERAGH
jgi:uncharacterized protein (TIGR03084 family)